MALIHCPECNQEVSESVEVCPHCGFNIYANKDFTPVVKQLSGAKTKGTGKMIAELIGSVILLAAGVALVSAGIGIVLIILGVLGFFLAFGTAKKYQQGECPYCGTLLNVDVPGTKAFKCPSCNNVGKRTDNTLESTH